MIRSTVRKQFRRVLWSPPETPLAPPTILVANHHGWHDGYLMYLAATDLGLLVVDWIQEYASFPLFGKVGGMPFPADDPAARAKTIRRTIRLMREERRSLILFAEGILHRPPDLLEFGKSLRIVAEAVPGCTVVPVGLTYQLSLHSRPEAFVSFGPPVAPGPDLCERTRRAVRCELDRTAERLAERPESWHVLAEGTPDINERVARIRLR